MKAARRVHQTFIDPGLVMTAGLAELSSCSQAAFHDQSAGVMQAHAPGDVQQSTMPCMVACYEGAVDWQNRRHLT